MNKIAQPTAKTQNDKLAWLNRIDFASEEAEKSAVIIGTTRLVDYQLKHLLSDQAICL